MTIWDVDYFVRGDVSEATRFFGDGDYLFLLTDAGIPTYLHDGVWVFQGLYLAVSLPPDFPLIDFPLGTNIASAVTVASVAEPSAFALALLGLALVWALSAIVRRQGPEHGGGGGLIRSPLL